MHKILEDLNWRYATKKYDSTKKVSEEDLEVIKESLRLVPTSYGLQTLKFLMIEDQEIREKLVPASFGQQQVQDASHLFVLCAYKDVTDKHVDDYAQNIATTRGQTLEDVAGYANYMKQTIGNLSPEHKLIWTSKQLYIALGQLLTTCAALRIDATPMEGFSPATYDEILELEDKNLTAVLVCPIGYRHEDDANQHVAKVRKSQDELFEIV